MNPKNPDLMPVPADTVVLLMHLPRSAMGALVDVLRALPPAVADAIRVSIVNGIGPDEPEPARPDPTPALWCHCETSTDELDGGSTSD